VTLITIPVPRESMLASAGASPGTKLHLQSDKNAKKLLAGNSW